VTENAPKEMPRLSVPHVIVLVPVLDLKPRHKLVAAEVHAFNLIGFV
jgi:hypothetical protein